MNMQQNVTTPSKIELACIDLLSHQGNILDQLVQANERPKSDSKMLEGAIEIVSCFLGFSERYRNDEDAIGLATTVAQIVDAAAACIDDFDQLSSWFGSKGVSKDEVRQRYLKLGAIVTSFCEKELNACAKFFPADSPHLVRFLECRDTFIQELRTQW